MKLYWKVDEKPTGRFRSFGHRGWPTAYHDKEKNVVAAAIYCDMYRYDVRHVRNPPKDLELIVRIADYSAKPAWKWRKARRTFSNLQDAKDFVEEILVKHPEIKPETI